MKCGESGHHFKNCPHETKIVSCVKVHNMLKKDCPNNDGILENESTFIFPSPKSPLSNWNTGFPFTTNDTEYICVEQYVMEQK